MVAFPHPPGGPRRPRPRPSGPMSVPAAGCVWFLLATFCGICLGFGAFVAHRTFLALDTVIPR